MKKKIVIVGPPSFGYLTKINEALTSFSGIESTIVLIDKSSFKYKNLLHRLLNSLSKIFLNKNLKKEILEGRFREDLYHRLAVILIKVPSLNDRREDIPLLVDYFADKIAVEQGTSKKSFSTEALSLLKSYDWTGNIRELRNVVERLIILGESEVTVSDVTSFVSK